MYGLKKALSGKTIQFLTTTFLFVSLSMMQGCVTQKGLIGWTKAFGKDSSDIFAKDSAYKNVTQYSDALDGMKELVDIYDKNTIYLAVEPIENQTAAAGKVPSVITMMVESSVNKMSCNKIVVVPYTDQTFSQYRNRRLYVVHGAITEFDSGIVRGSSGIDGSGYIKSGATDIDAGGNRDNDYERSSISIDFSMLDVRRNRYVTGLQVSNKMQVQKTTKSQGFGFTVFGSGMNVNASASYQQGIHSALRLLVELSMAELVGRFHDLPYWVTIYHRNDITGGVAEKMQTDFINASERDKAKQIQRLLSFVYGQKMTIDGVIGKKTKATIRKFKKENNIMPADSSLNKELYLEALKATADKFHNIIVTQSEG